MSNEAEKRAAELIKQAWTEFDTTTQDATLRALCNLIQHVSDVVERALPLCDGQMMYDQNTLNALLTDIRALILPKPVDPLTEVWVATLNSPNGIRNLDAFRAELAKRGGRIVFGDE